MEIKKSISVGIILSGLLIPRLSLAFFEPINAFSDREILTSTTTVRLWNAPQNILGKDGWEKMDLSLYADITGWHVKNAPYNVTLPEKARSSFSFDSGVSLNRSFTDASMVKGIRKSTTSINYLNAFPKLQASLVIESRNDGVAYLIEWTNKPSLCDTQESLSIPFTIDLGEGAQIHGVSAEREMLSRNDGVYSSLEVSDSISKVVIKKPHIWDNEGRESEISFVGNKDALAKVIPCSFFKEAAFPVYADDVVSVSPSPGIYEDGSIDGGGGPDWTTIITATNGTNVYNSATTGYWWAVVDNSGNEYREVVRGFMAFPPLGISAPNEIDSASLNVYVSSKSLVMASAANIKLALYAASPASYATYVSEDWDQIGSTEYTNSLSYNSITESAWNVYNFNAAGLAALPLNSVIKLSNREVNYDVDSSAYPKSNNSTEDNDGVLIRFSDYTGTAYDPYLEVTYSTPASSSSSSSSATSSASSAYSFDSGTGSLMTNTGSLVFGEWICDSYTDAEGTSQIMSGGVLVNVATHTPVCDHWRYAIKVPAVAFTFKTTAGTLFTFGAWLILLYVSIKTGFTVFKWFFNTLTRRR